MKTLSVRTRRNPSGRAMLAGIGTIAIDQHIRAVKMSRNGIADDWKAVADDLRRAMSRAGREAA